MVNQIYLKKRGGAMLAFTLKFLSDNSDLLYNDEIANKNLERDARNLLKKIIIESAITEYTTQEVNEILLPEHNENICHGLIGFNMVAGVNPEFQEVYNLSGCMGTELACLDGLESWFALPGTPGYTAVGEIIEKGSNVTHVEIGDIIYTFGPHAKYFIRDTKFRWNGLCIKVPDHLPEDVAAFAHMASIAFTSIWKSNIELGDYVLVIAFLFIQGKTCRST